VCIIASRSSKLVHLMNTTRPVLLVDVANIFLRNIAAYPQISSNGDPMGGFIGTLKSLKRIIGETGAKSVYMAWEGGGSSRRRQLFPEYKLKRKPQKLNRFYEDDIPTTDDNIQKQTFLLLQALKYFPVCQLYAENAEADDLIAYLCERHLKNENKIIVSSDKDFYQLLNDNTKIYNLYTKRTIDKSEVIKQFRISANNFAVAKALCGDEGDNVPGLERMGFKTLIKHFPLLGLEQDVSLDDIFNYCRTHIAENKNFKRVLDFENDARRNWQLVFLNGNMIAPNQAERIDRVIETWTPKVDKMSLAKLLINEGLNDINVNELLYGFNGIQRTK